MRYSAEKIRQRVLQRRHNNYQQLHSFVSQMAVQGTPLPEQLEVIQLCTVFINECTEQINEPNILIQMLKTLPISYFQMKEIRDMMTIFQHCIGMNGEIYRQCLKTAGISTNDGFHSSITNTTYINDDPIPSINVIPNSVSSVSIQSVTVAELDKQQEFNRRQYSLEKQRSTMKTLHSLTHNSHSLRRRDIGIAPSNDKLTMLTNRLHTKDNSTSIPATVAEGNEYRYIPHTSGTQQSIKHTS